MINTYLENDKAVYHITTSLLQYGANFFIIYCLSKELSRFSHRLIYMTFTAALDIYFISGWVENLYSQTTKIRNLHQLNRR